MVEKGKQEVAVAKTLGQVIGMHLNSVMLDSRNMREMESDIDNWILGQERSTERRTEVLGELKRGMGCLESLYSRISMGF